MVENLIVKTSFKITENFKRCSKPWTMDQFELQNGIKLRLDAKSYIKIEPQSKRCRKIRKTMKTVAATSFFARLSGFKYFFSF